MDPSHLAIGELKSLMSLYLSSNLLSGSIPFAIGELKNLSSLDLSANSLNGSIPSAILQLKQLTSLDFSSNIFSNIASIDLSDMLLNLRGDEIELSINVLSNIASIDLSDNNLSGNIPGELGNLIGLQSLNISGNHLIGSIPNGIGEMVQLESLDLSRNELSGAIPSSLSALLFLDRLNLSYNNLSERIPSGNQLQTLSGPSIYMGNNVLCGLPLTNNCESNEPSPVLKEEDSGETEMQWIYSGLAPEFVVGICIVWGVLVFKREWRLSFFRFTDNIYDRSYVFVAVGVAKLKRKMLYTSQVHGRG